MSIDTLNETLTFIDAGVWTIVGILILFYLHWVIRGSRDE